MQMCRRALEERRLIFERPNLVDAVGLIEPATALSRIDLDVPAIFGDREHARQHGPCVIGLWALNPGGLNYDMVKSNRQMIVDDPQVNELVALAFEPDPGIQLEASSRTNGRALAVGTREVDPKVMVQQGAFTIHADERNLAERPIEGYPLLAGFRIRRAAKPPLRELLMRLGITRSALFPDLGSLAVDLKHRPWAN